MTLQQKINKARAAVNTFAFGTAEFDAAFDACKALVQQQTDAAPTFEYTSIDGNIFAPA